MGIIYIFKVHMNAVAILDKMRAQLHARGAHTIRGLGRTFRHFDSVDGNRQCDANEFFTGLQDIGCNISKAESEALMKLLDNDGSGVIEAADLKGVYSANMHPKVISGEMTE